MEEMDIISNLDDIHEVVQCDNPDSPKTNIVLVENNGDQSFGQQCSNFSQTLVEPCQDSTLGPLDNNTTFPSSDNIEINVVKENSDNCGGHASVSCEFLKDSSTKGTVIVNQLGDEINDLSLSRSKYASFNYLPSKQDKQTANSEQDNESISSENSSVRDFLVIHESDSTVHSFNGTDSLKTCVDGDSLKTVSDDTEIAREEFETCSVKDDNDKTHSSSEIKERVMSYLNKHSVSCESSNSEQESSKMLVKETSLKTKKSLDNDNSSSKFMKEDTVLPFNSNSVMWNPVELPQDFQTQEPSSNVFTNTSCPTTKGKTVSSVSSSDIFQSTNSSGVCNGCKKKDDVYDQRNTPQCTIENINNNMEVTNETIEAANESVSDSFITAPLYKPSTDVSESEMQLSSPLSNTSSSSFIQSGPASSMFFLECKENVDLSDEGDTTLNYASERAIKSSDGSNTSFVNQSLQSFYNKSGTISTNSSLSSWGKLSFQPFTTPSIKSPIFSSKSNIEGKLLNTESLTKCAQITNSKYEIEKSTLSFMPKDDSNSRKTKSTEALFSSISFSTSSDTVFSENISGKSSSKISNLHFVSPMVHTESSWSENSLNKNTKFGPEKSFKDLFSITDSAIISSSPFVNMVGNGPFNRIPDNPFSRKPSESIGIFNSPQESVSSGFSAAFKPVLSTVFSPKREKFCERASSVSGDSTNKLSDLSKETTQFALKLNSEKKQEHLKSSMKFNFKCMEQSGDAKKCAFKPGCRSGMESRDSHLLYNSKVETAASQSNLSLTPYQFRLNGEKSKPSNTHRSTYPRLWKRAIKLNKQPDKGFSKFMKEANFSSSSIDLPNAPFKTAYGSDVILDKNRCAINVIVRYQNIVFMKEHLNVSPEELRVEYYNKTHVIGPFKFCASAEYNESHSHKKAQNKEIQTDDNLLSKRYELSEIWRALECPVCLDVVMPPIYQCEQGHHACLTCWNKVVTCPLCKRHKSVTRNYMAEALIDQIPLPCKYHIEGCKETVCRANKISHEETCLYRMYQCPVPSCNQAHSYQNMCTHFKKVHKSLLHHEGHSVGKGEKFCDVLYKDHLSSSLIHAFDITKWGLFFLREVVTKHSRALFVQVMPASPEPAAYFYHLEVCDHHDCRKECYKGRVFSMGKPTQEIVDEEEYLSLSELILKTVKKSAPLKIVVTIWQLKPAFTLSTE